MAVETQPLDIPFAGGPSTKLDEVLPDRTRLLALENGTFNEKGTLTRRDPWALVPGTSGIVPVEMATLEDELLAIDETTGNLYAYSPTSDALIAKGKPPLFQLGFDGVSGDIGYKTGVDHASTNGFSIYLWRTSPSEGLSDTGDLKYSVIDEADGTIIANAVTLVPSTADPFMPRVVQGGPGDQYFLIVWLDTIAGAIKMAAILASTGAVITPATIIASDAVNGGDFAGIAYDLKRFEFERTGFGLLAYSSTTAGARVRALQFNYLGTVVTAAITVFTTALMANTVKQVSLAPFLNINRMAVFATDSVTGTYKAIIGYTGGVLSVTSAGALLLGPALNNDRAVTAVVDPATGNLQGFLGHAGNRVTGNNIINSVRPFTLTSAGVAVVAADLFNGQAVTTGPAMTFYFGAIASQAFATRLGVFVVISLLATAQNARYVIDTSGNVVAVMLYGLAMPGPTGGIIPSDSPFGFVPNTVPFSSTSFSIPALRVSTLSFASGEQTTQSTLSRVRLTLGRTATDGAAAGPLWHAQTAHVMFFSGSFLAMYDGGQVAEAGFFYFPSVTATASGVGVTATISVVALYEWVDNLGQRHQSAPSLPFVVVMANNGTVTMRSTPLLLGIRKTTTTVVFYRTVNGGTTYYRVNSPNAPLGNTPVGGTVDYADTTVTSNPALDPITGNEILYTTGGALPNDNPPACTAIGVYQDRLVYSNAEDTQEWRFSQVPVPNQGLYFSEVLTGDNVPQGAGPITALAPMDDKLIVTTPTHALVTNGTGPGTTGLGGTYADLQLLTTDVGCVDQRSIALLPDVTAQDGGVGLQSQGGLGHQTEHGYYMLDRSLTDRYVGMPLARILEGATVSSATVQTERHQLRLTTVNAVAVYDYLMGQWSTFRPTDGGSGVFVASVIWDGKWTAGGRLGHPDGLVLMLANTPQGETPGIFQDAPGTWRDYGDSVIIMSLTTAWIHVAALQGFQRVKRVALFGPYGSQSLISLTPQYDFDQLENEPTLSMESLDARTGDGRRWQFRVMMPRQKCQAVRFLVTDVPTSDPYTGVGFSGLTLDLGVKTGLARLPATKGV